MAAGLLPVIGQTPAAEGEHAAGEIGAIRSGQDEEAGVVGDKGEAAAVLGNVSSQPLLAVFEVVGRRTPAQEGDLAPIHFGHVAELLADEGVALEIVVFFHEFAENPAFRSIARSERTRKLCFAPAIPTKETLSAKMSF